LAEASVNNQFTIFGGTANPAPVRAIARELGTSGELNVGQLARQKFK